MFLHNEIEIKGLNDIHGGMVSAPRSIKDTLLWRKAEELVDSVNAFSKQLPVGDIYNLDSRLRQCVGDLPCNIENCFRQSNGVAKLRSMIKTNTYLEECKDYLRLIENLKYGQTEKLVKQVEEISDLMMKTNGAFNGLN